MSRLLIWIDATSRDHERRIFGMSLLERLLRGVEESDCEPDAIEVALAGRSATPELPAELTARLPVRFSHAEASFGERLARAWGGANGALLALSSDSVVDPRLIARLAGAKGSLAFLADEDGGRAAVVRLEPEAGAPDPQAKDLRDAAERALATGAVKALPEAEFDGYVEKLRRRVAPYLFRIDGREAITRVERFLFWSNYKGSTDFMTRYVYPPLVWALLRPLARRRVHPNWITAFNWMATFACLPLFARGAWIPGLALAYLMSVLDSVDGKLARLTYTSSRVGDVLDHGLDIVHPPFWYLAWGFALGDGSTASAPYQAALVFFAVYVLDRIVAAIFRERTGTSIHGATPTDEWMRTFISRRNVNLPIFTVGLLVDALAGTHVAARAAFYLIVAWQALSLAWHAQRLGVFWSTRLR